MIRRMALSTVIALLAVCAVPAVAQEKLGDFVTNGGYDWVLGRWAAVTDEGKVELEYKWGLDKHIVLAEVKMGDYKQSGLVMLSPDRGEVIGVAADNKGNTWKGDWTDEGGDLVYRLRQTAANGQVNKMEVVHEKVDSDTVTVALYGVGNGGYRNAEPMGKLTYKRQPATAADDDNTSDQTRRWTNYETLGDLVSQGGYEWMAGKWLATDPDQKYELEYKWALDKHVVLGDLKMGDFAYRGMIMYNPASQEIFQVGADNMGGVWNGTWSQGYDGAVHRVEYTGADGVTRKMEHVYQKTDDNAFQVKEYRVESGYRSSEARRTLTFNRQKAASQGK